MTLVQIVSLNMTLEFVRKCNMKEPLKKAKIKKIGNKRRN